MLGIELKRLVSWIAHRHHVTKAHEVSATLDFDPAWHGDHWQNLLSSPMDARHYVMEDWAMTMGPTFDASLGALPDSRGSNRKAY